MSFEWKKTVAGRWQTRCGSFRTIFRNRRRAWDLYDCRFTESVDWAAGVWVDRHFGTLRDVKRYAENIVQGKANREQKIWYCSASVGQAIEQPAKTFYPRCQVCGALGKVNGPWNTMRDLVHYLDGATEPEAVPVVTHECGSQYKLAEKSESTFGVIYIFRARCPRLERCARAGLPSNTPLEVLLDWEKEQGIVLE